ncbi:hypothetical protein QL285_009153 [Trifolium repens]|nr:hypothetical protein QL285_009153 [Trifolium repens]
MVAERLPAMKQARRGRPVIAQSETWRRKSGLVRWMSLLVAGQPHEFLGSRRTHESSLAATDWWLSEQTQILMLCSRVSHIIT